MIYRTVLRNGQNEYLLEVSRNKFRFKAEQLAHQLNVALAELQSRGYVQGSVTAFMEEGEE